MVLLECDERQHAGYTPECEVVRMLDVQAALSAEDASRKLLWVRFNPDAFRVDGVLGKVLVRDRLAALVRFIESYVPTLPMEIAYLYYDTREARPVVVADGEAYPRAAVALVTQCTIKAGGTPPAGATTTPASFATAASAAATAAPI